MLGDRSQPPYISNSTKVAGFYRATPEIQPQSILSKHAPAREVLHSSFTVTGDVISGRKSCSVSFRGGGEAKQPLFERD
ncbi:hypothetical protein KY290_025617 [Solanum tuberosum]|uniref:Uncharacterized protein n=1 Tax=Solanum tuberosum TaxID=4113 RepID=A0ABQ7UW72_SOLTU|nr:hypothetical protein KY289_024691 [Solanum tuberosum]KAH0755347.1 hypothetical protein KY290_025617 [Solanum tuberosum]